MTSFLCGLPLWGVESSTILLSRFACGDESTLELGDRYLTEDLQENIAERHPSQVASMLESRMDGDR